MKQYPLEKAREFILSFSHTSDAASLLSKLSALPQEEISSHLFSLYTTAASHAEQGNTQEISTLLRVFDHFHDDSHTRMLLHYLAQAQANKALNEMKQGRINKEEIENALKNIADAFADANAINDAAGIH